MIASLRLRPINIELLQSSSLQTTMHFAEHDSQERVTVLVIGREFAAQTLAVVSTARASMCQ
jgi:hypothetical protein